MAAASTQTNKFDDEPNDEGEQESRNKNLWSAENLFFFWFDLIVAKD